MIAMKLLYLFNFMILMSLYLSCVELKFIGVSAGSRQLTNQRRDRTFNHQWHELYKILANQESGYNLELLY